MYKSLLDAAGIDAERNYLLVFDDHTIYSKEVTGVHEFGEQIQEFIASVASGSARKSVIEERKTEDRREL